MWVLGKCKYTILSFIILTSCGKNKIVSIEDTGSLPKIEINMDDYHLWSPDSGLYVSGNWDFNWEHPAQIKHIENNEIVFEEQVGIRIKGNRTRKFAMKSFGFYFRNEYGNKKLEYPVFN